MKDLLPKDLLLKDYDEWVNRPQIWGSNKYVYLSEGLDILTRLRLAGCAVINENILVTERIREISGLMRVIEKIP